jgi:hypothetical protein
MIASVLSKPPAPKAADWGFKLTVCIAVLCNEHKTMVTVSDWKVNFGDFAADNVASKQTMLASDYQVLFAGNDTEHVVPIIERAREILLNPNRSVPELRKALEMSPVDVANALDEAFAERLHVEINNRVLRKRGFTVDSFRDTGKQKCTTSAYLALCSRIDQVSISLISLMCGFDKKGMGHIYSVDGKSAPKCYDSIGMWAIGSGAHAALSSLAFHADKVQLNRTTSIEKATYLAIAAKFMAESSSEAGKGATNITISEKDKMLKLCVPTPRLEKIRSLWEKEGAPRIPENIETTMKSHIMTPLEALASYEDLSR